MFAESHSINFKAAVIVNRCIKNLSEMAAHKKGLWSKVVVPKKHFFFVVCYV